MTNVLIVDDEFEIRMMLGRILKQMDFVYSEASNALEARKILKEKKFDLVCSDINMPGESGTDLTRFILKEYPETAVIICTVIDDIKIARSIIDMGAYGYIIKPFDSNEVIIQISNVLRRQQLEIENRKYVKNLEKIVQERTASLRVTNATLKSEIDKQKHVEQQLFNSREQLRKLAGHLQTLREEERIRIAREVHDLLGQVLVSVKLDLSYIMNKIKKGDKTFFENKLFEELNEILKKIDLTIDSIGKIVTELRIEFLDELGLIEAFEWYTKEFEKRTKIKCTFISKIKEVNFDKKSSIAIFRIFQETLLNVARHAKANYVNIKLEKVNENLFLEIKDNGIGIEEGIINNSKSIGLIGMRERAIYLGGDFKLTGIPDKGTTVTLIVPEKSL